MMTLYSDSISQHIKDNYIIHVECIVYSSMLIYYLFVLSIGLMGRLAAACVPQYKYSYNCYRYKACFKTCSCRIVALVKKPFDLHLFGGVNYRPYVLHFLFKIVHVTDMFKVTVISVHSFPTE